MGSFRRCCAERGQGTVEASFVLPILMGLVLLLIQPGIILYDRTIMAGAASEACRLLATSTDSFGSQNQANEAFVRHRLAAIPAQENFHDHSSGCPWAISLSGNENASSVSVEIRNKLKPLPLIAFGMAAFDMLDENGDIEVKVSSVAEIQPEWVRRSTNEEASRWPGLWLK